METGQESEQLRIDPAASSLLRPEMSVTDAIALVAILSAPFPRAAHTSEQLINSLQTREGQRAGKVVSGCGLRARAG